MAGEGVSTFFAVVLASIKALWALRTDNGGLVNSWGMQAEVKTGPSVQLASMAQNMYRVGDYVYIDLHANQPYAIRRIEELNKTATGTVEAKVVAFYRRRDLPAQLLKIADRAERQNEIQFRPRRSLLSKKSKANGDEPTENQSNGSSSQPEIKEEGKEASKDDKEESQGLAGLPQGADELTPEQIHQLRQHELFLSRQHDTLQATMIRGKCTVVMLNEVETCDSYLNREDAFFYSLVYDASNQTLLADKGKIDVGERHQADIPDILPQEVIDRERGLKTEEKEEEVKENGDLTIDEAEEEKPDRQQGRKRRHSQASNGVYETRYEQVVYHPYHNLGGRDIDQFLIIARAVGTFSRALDTSSTMKLPSLHMTAAAASRDVTLFHAMAILHQAKYDIGQAVRYLVPPPSKQHYPLLADEATGHNTVSLGGPILCRDQLEEWSASEATLFEEAIEKCGKDFHDIRNDCLPWKSLKDIVEYYYMWKTTARYADHQRAKTAEQESKLKQVYIPSYFKPHANLLNETSVAKYINPCESCKNENASQWYSWGPQSAQLKICNDCWQTWKKHGGLKRPHEYETYDLDGSGDRKGLTRSGTRNNGIPAKVSQHVFQTAKGRGAFYLNTNIHARVARRMAPKEIYNVRKSARSPQLPIDFKAAATYYYSRELPEVLKAARQIKPTQRLAQQAVDIITTLHAKYGTH
ncbi:unnamed protein product [Bursaphelenchus xylophilus]|uniref:(pine wood nematode) hypothetical protein n=1 Tax=Bursaphelenchus xylophilus TaxID=6326 RepID=A0A1I7RT85_BURXY|nr:unnamed protein product [Bursaphelenchus xylophilus]CAG9122540.1 unnamed protein product [Bursaphelenchus xylophilus]